MAEAILKNKNKVVRFTLSEYRDYKSIVTMTICCWYKDKETPRTESGVNRPTPI